ncbi:MAG: hypothetical protein KKH98_06605 [Spirochaetes bacterium]|nr:hypothetical protein [Spirochaetota bacterium]
MIEQKIVDEIEEKIGRDDLFRYLSGEFGEKIYFDIDDQIIEIPCPGWQSIDMNFYVWDGLMYDKEKDLFFDEDGNSFNDLDLIQLVCEDGDVTEHIKELQDMIKERIQNGS